MIVYHGSSSNFKTLRISQSLVKHNSTVLNEGIGIYFSTDINVARSYGKYLYTLEINDKYFKDFRKKSVCKAYLQWIRNIVYKQEKVDIANYIDLEQLALHMYAGGRCIYKIGDGEIRLCLDSNENWYRLSQSKIERIYSILRRCDKTGVTVYMFNYNIKDIGVIKRVNEDIVRIIRKEMV